MRTNTLPSSTIVTKWLSHALVAGALIWGMGVYESQAQTCVTPPAGLVSWWRGESNALDAVGGNPGTLLNSTTFGAGEVGQAFNFNGTGAHVRIHDSASLHFSNAMTIELWLNPSGFPADQQIVSKWDAVPGVNQRCYVLGVGTDGKPYLSLTANGLDSGDVAVTSSVALTAHQWTHLAATYDGAAIKVYLNGTLQGSNAYTGLIYASTNDLAIGAAVGGVPAGQYVDSFGGLMDEVSIYGRALTLAEIQSIYNAGSAGKCTSALAPVIVSQPTNQTVTVGASATFTVSATGSAPLYYQWSFGSSNTISGATNSTLVLSNVVSTNAGAYYVTVSNAFGSTNSTGAVLTINPPPCTPPPTGLVSWWKGESNALDQIGTNNGTLLGNAAYGAGEVGQAFVFSGTGAGVQIGNPASLQLQNFSIEAWVKRADTNQVSSSPDGGIIFGYGDRGYAFGLINNGQMYISQVDIGGVFSSVQVTDLAWHHVALTKTNSSIVFYVDGVAYPASDYSTTFQFTTAASIGIRADLPRNSFLGSIDEVSVYNRVLGASEVQGIFNAGSSGKCPVGNPPTIVNQPSNQNVSVGATATFTVNATGSAPLYYQWSMGASNILGGATNSTLILSNVLSTNAGTYFVTVSNAFGSTNSTGALLTVSSGPTCTSPPGGLVGWWPAEGNALDQLLANNGTLVGNVTYGTGEVGQAFVLNGNGEGVQIGNPGSLQLQNFTIEAWVKRGSTTQASLTQGGGVVFGYGDGGYAMVVADNGQLFLSQVDDGAVNSAAQVTDLAWHHVAVTKTNSAIVFYVDGVAYPAAAYNPTFQFHTLASIGIRIDNANNSFLGSIDEVSVYNRALGASEVQAIYTAASLGKCPIPQPPTILSGPTNLTVLVGSSATFTVNAAGSTPLYYQWSLGTSNLISGATNSTLVISNVSITNAGTYYVAVSNAYGSTNSGGAVLNVTIPPTCYPAPSGLVSWWKGESNFFDSAGTNNGTAIGTVTFPAGEVGHGMGFNGSRVDLGNPASLQLQNFTIDAWIQIGNTNLLVPGGTGTYGEIISYWLNGYAFLVGSGGQLGLSQVGVGGIFSTNKITDQAFHHVAVTRNGSSVVFYLDGVAEPPQTYGATFQFTSSVAIGGSGNGNPSGFFNGVIDEVDVFNRALSSAEVQSIYNSGATGKCPIIIPPSIVTQPTNQTVTAGLNATFTVSATGSNPLYYQWSLGTSNISGATNASLTLTGVGSTNAGTYYVTVTNAYGTTNSTGAVLTVTTPLCTPAPSGLVGWWAGESNALDQYATNNGTLIGSVTYDLGEVGQAFVFSGSGQGVQIGNPTSLQLQNLTIEAWVKRASMTQASLTSGGGIVFGYGDGGYAFGLTDSGQLFLTQVDISAVTSSVQIIDLNWHHIALTKTNSSVVFYVDGIAYPATAYNPAFSFHTLASIGIRADNHNNSFLGKVDEVSVYNRALGSSEILSIYNAASVGKCPAPPAIGTQPTNTVVTVGNNAAFSVVAYGQPPLSYQWFFGVSNLPTSTNATLSLTNVQLNQAGNYSVVVSNSTGMTVTSSNAVLTVNPPPAVIYASNVTATSGLLTVPIDLIAQGNENALGFSFTFNTNRLTFSSITLGSGAGAAGDPIVNTNLLGSGKMGVALALPANQSFKAGTNEVVDLNFFVSPVTSQTTTPITFGDSPVVRSVSNPQAVSLASTFINGTETIPVLGVEADVAPRTNGDGAVGVTDWVQVGRFVAGLDTISNASEFQRADSAPRATLGDGKLTVADWVQAGRYFAQLDPLVAAGGPTQSGGGGLFKFLAAGGPNPLVSGRTITAINTSAQAGQPVQVSVQLNSQGNENALGFNVDFDPTVMTFTGAVVGTGAAGASLIVNNNQAASGTVGILLGLNPGVTFSSGTQEVVRLSFQVASGAGGSTNVTFGSGPVTQDVSDVAANDLTATYINGQVSITPITRPVLTAVPGQAGLVLSWPVTATGFILESNTDMGSTNWSAVNATLTTNGASISVTNPVAGSQLFYRLRYP